MRTSLCVNTKLTYKFKKKVVGCNKVTYGQVSSRYSVLGAFPVSAFKFSPVCRDSVRKARILLIFYPSPLQIMTSKTPLKELQHRAYFLSRYYYLVAH